MKGNNRKSNEGKAGVQYDQVAAALREEIRDGVYDGLHPFPSLTKIMRRFGVSRPSAVRSVAALKQLGLVRTSQGQGTFLARTSRTIGLAIPGTADSEFFSAVMDGLVAECAQADMDLVAGDTFPKNHRRRAEQAERLARHFAELKVAGVLLQPVGFNPDAERINRLIEGILSEAGIPVVLIDYDIVVPPDRSGYDLVAIDNFDAGRRVAAHLVAAGAKRVACLRRALSAESVWIRFASVQAFVRRNGTTAFGFIDAEPDDARAVAEGLKTFRPDAIVCSNDQAAAILAKTLRKLRVRIPGDVLLAGFDDVRVAREMKPPLTTIHQPCADLAAVAFRTLMERIANPDLPPREILLDAPLVVRESTKRPSVAVKGKRA